MEKATIEVIEAILNADQSMGTADRQRMLKMVVENGGNASDLLLQNRLIRRSEVARLLSRSVSSVDRLVRLGVLEKVVFPGYERSAGFRMSDVVRLIGGNPQ